MLALLLALTASGANATGWVETQKLVASSGVAEFDDFGINVALSGDVALVADTSDHENGPFAGAVYVFRRDGVRWVEEQKLLAGDGGEVDFFGSSLALSGDTAFVGTGYDDNENGLGAGAVYVFHFDGTRWVEHQKLLASDGEEHARFGLTLEVAGDELFVGAWYDIGNGERSGAVYVFRSAGGEWVEQQKLFPAQGAETGEFGKSISVSGDFALIGAQKETHSAGAVYVFRRVGTGWVEQERLVPANPATGNLFGQEVHLSGDMALVGAPRTWATSSGMPDSRGSVYYFRFDGTAWSQEQELRASPQSDEDRFGASLAVSGDRALIGSWGDDTNGDAAGAAYVFRFDGLQWVEEQRLLASDGKAWDFFGYDVAFSDGVALVGAHYGRHMEATGAAYVFETRRPHVNLKVNGRESLFVTSGRRVRLTLDMTAGPRPLDHYYYWWVGGRYYWLTQGGVSTVPAPLASFAPVDLTDVPLYDGLLPHGLWSFGWLMMDGTTLVDRDRVVVLVTRCLDAEALCAADTSGLPELEPPLR